MSEFIRQFENEIAENNEHILFKKKATRYYCDFIDALAYLEDFDNIKKKLQLSKKFNEFVYFQNISEIMLWIYCLKNKFDFHIEKKLSSENNTDVDVAIIKDEIAFNIEVKCPEFEKVDAGVLALQNSFRTVPKEQYSAPTCQDNIFISLS